MYTKGQHANTQHDIIFIINIIIIIFITICCNNYYELQQPTQNHYFTHFSFVAYSVSIAHFSFTKCSILSQNSAPFCVWATTLSNWS